MDNQGIDEKYQERVNGIRNKILADYQLMVDNIRSVLEGILNLKAIRARFSHFLATLTFNQ